MFKRHLSRRLILCSLIATFSLSTAALADPSYSGGDGPGQYAGVPDEIQTRQPPQPPASTGKVTGSDWSVTSLSKTTDASGSITLNTTRSTLSWQAMLTVVRLELRVLVLRF